MALDTLLDPVLNPLLSLGPFWVIVIISAIIAVFTTVIYKYTTDQEALRKLKADLKRYQKKAQDAQKAGNTEKSMKVQKDMMKINGQYMKASFKSTLYTFIPVLIFFGWLGAHLTFAPLMPGDPFSITAELQPGVSGSFVLTAPSELSIPIKEINVSNSSIITWNNISGPAGQYELSIKHLGSGEEHFVSVLISEIEYLRPVNTIEESTTFSSITIDMKKLYVFKNVFLLKDFPWIKNMGWLWAYILFSILFSTSLRKAMKLA